MEFNVASIGTNRYSLFGGHFEYSVKLLQSTCTLESKRNFELNPLVFIIYEKIVLI